MLLKSNLLKPKIPVKHLHNYSPKVNSQKQWYIIPISHCPVLFFLFCEEGLVYLSSGLDPRRGEKILVGSEFKANNKLLIKIHIRVHTHTHTEIHTFYFSVNKQHCDNVWKEWWWKQISQDYLCRNYKSIFKKKTKWLNNVRKKSFKCRSEEHL